MKSKSSWLIVVPFLVISSFNLCAQKNIRFRSNIQYPRILSNIWGYTDTVTGKEFALVGEETGLDIVDVTDPDNPIRLFFIPNDTSIWQEPKVWSHYAYMTNENGGGLLIVDLGDLPNTANYVKWSGIPSENYQKSHTCFIDEQGILYLNGSNLFNRGTILCDLKISPMNPVYLGKYDDFYVHDCFARNDTLYTAEILNGQFSVIDVHDKANPVVISRQNTPFAYSHNVWPSDDGKYLFNTDEKKFAPVTAYDITNLNDIIEIDEYRHSDFDSSIPHNTYYLNGYLFTSYYRDGVTIVDAHKPDNLVETGNFDTSPFPPGNGFEGCWGVYCYLPSGNIICSDRQEGLFVLTPTLVRACYIEGTVTNQSTGQSLPGITVDIIGNERLKQTNVLGDYKTGIADSGLYDIRFTDFTANHCLTKIVSGVNLQPGQITTLNVMMDCPLPSGIQELSSDFYLKAQPSVFKDHTQIIFHSASDEQTLISICSIDGRLLKSFSVTTPNANIQIGDYWALGTYIVTVSQGERIASVKMMKVLN